MKAYLSAVAAMAALVVGGCGQKSQPVSKLRPQEFYAARPGTQPAVAANGNGHNVLAANTARTPATRPSTQPVISLGQYMILGTVVAEANGAPIYADKVLVKLDPALSQHSRTLAPPQFKAVADKLIREQVSSDIREELEYAAAERTLTDEEKQIATAITVQWRQKEITRVGGSLAVARDRSLNPADGSMGINFDERVHEQYRRHMSLLYYQRHVWPRVQITADDMRRFYERNREEVFTEKAGVLFRVIRLGFRERGKAEAIRQAAGVYERAQRGEDFGLLASSINDNASWKRNSGYWEVAEKRDREGNTYMRTKEGQTILRDKEGFGLVKDDDGNVIERSRELLEGAEPVRVQVYVAKGTMANTKLENAVFALQKKGDVTVPFEVDGDGVYIAMLEDQRTGKVKMFEEEAVQTAIRRTLESDQRQALRAKEQDKLRKAASGTIRTDEKQMDTALEMAMQKYYLWARRD